MRVLLINPICYNSIENFIKDSKKMKINADEPIGLMYLSATIKRNLPEIKTEIYDHHLTCLMHEYDSYLDYEKSIYILKDKIKQFNPDIVCISGLYEYNKQPFHETLRIIKEANKDIITIVGGIYPTTNDISFDKNIDYVITGEGEVKLYGLMLDLINKKKHSWYKIPIDYNKDIGLDHLNKPYKRYPSKIDYYLPDRDNLDLGYYATYGRQLTQRIYKDNCRTATIQISRGCPCKCTYCSGHTISNRDYRTRSIDNIISEIIMLKDKYDIEVFIFNEENPNIDIKHTKKLYKALIPLKIKWYSNAGFYVHNMDYEFIELAMKSGLIYWNLAIESGSKRIQKLTNKSEKIIDNAEKVINWIRQIDSFIYINTFWMFGFPFETWQDIKLSIKLAKKLDADWYQINQLQLFKGCKLYDEHEKYKSLNEKDYLSANIKNSIIDNKKKSDYIYKKMNIDLNFKKNRCMKTCNYKQVFRDMTHIMNITNGKHKQAKKILDKLSKLGYK